MKFQQFTLLFLLSFMACSSKELIPSDATNPPTRGVWLTNVDSEALFSKAEMEEAVDLCAKYGFNSIFVVTWNRGYSLYPSAIME